MWASGIQSQTPRINRDYRFNTGVACVSTKPTNDEWLRRLRNSDASERDAALSDLRDLIVRGLNRSLNNHYGTRSFNAEDVAQEALLKIMNALDNFEGRSRFTTWAMSIATRVGLSEYRRRHTKDISLDGIGAGDSLKFEFAAEGTAPVGQAVDQQAILSKLDELIEVMLTDKQRLAIRGLLEGLPVEEIASRTNSNRNAVYKLVHDARTKLKQGFEKSGIVAEDISAIFA